MTTGRNALSLVEVIPGATAPANAPRARLVAIEGRGRDVENEQVVNPQTPCGLLRGKVLASEGTAYIQVALDDGPTTAARRAAGCLLRPEPGDTVLVHVPEVGDVFVLSVLERANPMAVLDVPGELRIEATSRLDLTAPEMRLQGRTGRFEFMGLDLLAGTIAAKAGRVAAVAAAVESRIGDLSQNIRLSVRQVETEIVRAGGIRQFIRGRLLIRAGRASVLAEDEVTVDAKKIHLG